MKYFMQVAILESIKNVSKSGSPFAALVVNNGKVIAIGYNEVSKKSDPTAHSAIVAIRKASKKLNSPDLSSSELYLTSYPCPMCLSAIALAKLKKVYYYFDLEKAHKAGFVDKELYNLVCKKSSKIKVNFKKTIFALEEDPFEIWEEKNSI